MLWPVGRRGRRHVGFERFDAPDARAALENDGVRIFGPKPRVAQDLEPEYIAVDGDTAYVTLQENNAMAIIDIAGAHGREDRRAWAARITRCAGNALDPSDQDGGSTSPIGRCAGCTCPTPCHAFSDRKGRPYLIMANEGDAREYRHMSEAVRARQRGYLLDPIALPERRALLKAERRARSVERARRPAVTPTAMATSTASTSSAPARSRSAT